MTTRATKTPRLDADRWLREAMELLGEAGVAAVRVEPLAERLGVSKGSFYWHFADRPALLAGLLAHWRKVATDAVIAQVERGGGDARARLERLLDIGLGSRADRREAAIRAWSAHDADAAAAIAEVDAARERFVAKELEAAGLTRATARRRARVLYLALIGEFTRCASGAAPSDRAVFRELLALLGEGAVALPEVAATGRAGTAAKARPRPTRARGR